MKKYKGIIFDLDGTLVDSMWIWEQIDLQFLKARGYELPIDLQKDIEGSSFSETAFYFKNRFNLEEDVEVIKKIWIDMAETFYGHEIKLKKGVLNLLKKFKAQGIKMAVATSNSRILAEMVLRKNDIFDYFEVIVTSCDVKKGKPAPDVFLEAANQMGVLAENCLVFEDTHSGVLGAKDGGMDVVAIYDPLSEAYTELIKEVADDYLPCFSQWVS